MHDHHRYTGIIPWFAANPVAANLLLLLVIALGLMTAGSLRKEAFPSMEPNKITISVAYSSGSATQSEEGLAIKIEEQLQGVSGIESITSVSNGSGSTVTVEKQSDYALDTLMRDVEAKVNAISGFPAEAENPVIEKAQREEHALWLQLYGDADRQTLQQLAEALKRDLLASANISSVSLSGWLDPMMLIEVDEARLQAYGLSLTDIETAINAGSSDASTAVLSNARLYLQLKASEQAYQSQDFAALPLLSLGDGRQLRLGEVATIRDDYSDDSASLSRFQGKNSLALQVVTTGQDDISDSVASARQVIRQWHADGRLPKGVELASWYDRSTSIDARLQLLLDNALGGILLVFVLLALFLNLTVAFWVAMGLPFIFFGTLYFMGDGWLGLSLNEFTTFGFIMALGIVVDDAVVVGESVYTERALRGDKLGNTIRGTLRVAVPTLFGVLTTVAAFYSLSQLSGRLGQLYAQFASVVTVCLLLSLVESKLILPAHLAHLDTRRRRGGPLLLRLWQRLQQHAETGLEWFSERCYQPAILLALHYRHAVLVLFVALFALVMAMPMTGAVRISFFPDIPGDTVRAELSMQNDASFGLTHANLNRLEADARAVDAALRREAGGEHEGDSAIAHLQVLSEAAQSGQVTVELKKGAPYDINSFTRRWREQAGMPEGARTLAIQNTPRRVDALRIELRATDDEVLTRAGEALKAHLAGLPAVSGVADNLEPGQPQLHLQLTQQGRALGMTTETLAAQVLQTFKGQVVQRYQRNSDEIEVRVRYPEAARQSLADVMKARVRTSEDQVVPLSSVATATLGYARDSITRIDGKRAVYISADINKERLSASELVSQLQRQLVPTLERQYPGLAIQFAGEAKQQAETQTSMLKQFLLAMLIIYMLLAIPLRSYVQPLLIMTAIPFGIIGAILGHWLYDLPLGILSLNGIIALSGVVVNDSLLLVSRFNELKQADQTPAQRISLACRSRLRAVLLTSVTTFAGLLPLLGETSLQAQFLIPAAVSLAYGILFATLITLILIPAQLLVLHDIKAWYARRRAAGAAVEEARQPC